MNMLLIPMLPIKAKFTTRLKMLLQDIMYYSAILPAAADDSPPLKQPKTADIS